MLTITQRKVKVPNEKVITLDLTGQIFGRLIVKSEAPSPNKKRRLWLCFCECGKAKTILMDSLRNGKTKSCGCLQIEIVRKQRELEGVSIPPGSRFGNLVVLGKGASVAQLSGIRKGRMNGTLKCKCLLCGVIKIIRKNSLLRISKNPKNCGCKRYIRKTLKYRTQINGWEILGEGGFYNSKDHKRLLLCKCICGITKKIMYGNLIRGGSKNCGHDYKRSNPEKELCVFLRGITGKGPILNARNLFGSKNRKEIDLYLPKYKVGVEFNGNYWHSEKFKSNSKCHSEKRVLAESKGIRLIQIRSDEWLNKRNIVESMLRQILGLSKKRYFARKLKIDIMSPKLAQQFLSENHLMGVYKAGRSVGLYTPEGGLVQLFVYRLQKNQTELECARICSLTEHSVVGGVSRLLKHALRQHSSIQRVTSFVDLRYGTGKSLEKIGFKKVSVTLGWGWTDGREVFNRLRCRANMDSRRLTQKQHAEELGWFKLFDAGQAKWVLRV